MMEVIFYTTFLLAFKLDVNEFSIAGNTPYAKGVETRIVAELGPHGTDKAACEKYADGQRKEFTARWNEDNKRKEYAARPNIADYRLIKYACVPLALSIIRSRK